MAAEGVLVFDDGPDLTTVEGESGQAFVILEETNDVLVFDSVPDRAIQDSTSSSVDFLLIDTQATVTEVQQAPADFVLIDPPKDPAQVVLDGPEFQDVYVITSGGPPGPPGPEGRQGQQGLPGMPGPGAYYQEFGFATPATTWTVVHNVGTLGLSVETVDTNGGPIEGYVRYVDLNTIEIDWYYPTAGAARVFR